MVAALLVLSFGLIAFAGCGGDDDENEGGGGGGGGESTSAAKFVTDTSLQDKLLAMYPFEEGSASGGDTLYAYNPFNGSAITSANGEYDSAITGQATTAASGLTQDQYQLTSPSTKALNSSYAVSLSGSMNELYQRDSNDEIAWDNGVSVSFWAYNYEKDKTVSSETEGTLAIDYANIAYNGTLAATWGNINNGGKVSYPDKGTTVGRAAYTDEFITGEKGVGSYYDAIAAGYTTAQMEYFDSRYSPTPYDYTGWNVISGNVQDADAGSTVDVISEYCYHTWRYVTLSIQTDGIYFYMNGRLAYYYSAEGYLTASPGWMTRKPTSATTASHYYRFLAGLVGGTGENTRGEEIDYIEDFNFMFNLFGADAKAYVDDMIIGYALDADEACALYENLSGVTYDAADLVISTGGDPAEEAKQDAKVEAVEDRVTEYETAVSESEAANGYTATLRDALIADGLDDYESSALETIGVRSVNGTGTVGGTKYYVPTVDEDGTFELSVTVLQLSSMSDKNYYQGLYPMVYERDGSNWSKVVGFQSGGAGSSYGSGSSETWMSGIAIDEKTSVGNVEGLDNAQASNGLVWTGESDTGVDFTEVSHYCWIVVTLEWDGTNLTLSWTYYYYFADETLEWTYEYNGTQSASEKIGFMAASSFGTIGYTIEAESGDLSDLFDTSDLAIRLGSENTAYVVVTGVEGGEVYGQS